LSGYTAARLADLRQREFPGLGETIHLNSASYAPVPASAQRAAAAFEQRRSAAALLPDDFGPILQRARVHAAALVGGTEAEIALVPNTSVGLNLAADLVRQRADRADARAPRTIVIPDGEFPANVYCWMALEKHGFRLERLPTGPSVKPDEARLVERVQRGDVAALAISAVQFVSGYMADLARLGAACREAGVLFVVDGIQAAGVTPLDVVACDVDVFATGGHKWLCGPFGTGFVFIRRQLGLEFEPDLPGWLAFQSSKDFSQLLSYDWDLFDDARRFEVGSLPIQGFVALAESMALLDEIGTSSIRAQVQRLSGRLLDWAATRPDVDALVGEPDRLAGIVSLRMPDAAAVHASLLEAGISTVPREGAVRFAPHWFNTDDEMDRVIAHLQQHVPQPHG
jgi:cysteine desulfurase / selenocysteine lyase